ncbi:MAG: NifB/NifX family molybdenum-iron cluster-binding protein [Desulfarculaceae bacterium]|nr:NifB/NifX family molybdenum-iron cluster-binding protein [Desulfarculaceae bacterium]
MAKIAISSQGKNLESQVDPRFGRAAYFLVVDDNDDAFVVLDNSTSRDMSSGAGIQAAEAVARSGAKVVVSGLVGPKAMQALQAVGITVVQGAEGSVEEALLAYRQGTLKPDDRPMGGGR